ncbi:12S rRNA N(4)-cytidine methyltransferase METTL15 isoform X4 [Homo sapiens]|uniref:12S rRNA N(4)-cytidine methyltransferase METTL15 isoform X4 n=1 Tax=Homo sapiens TaxID=9606 RepID=UPI0003EAF699|nr:12S rRNA N4-methylcytidine (m4C) methyltransferase isoform X4 [Homo sapiens]|eukprot:XP_011518243.1 probable methyltransferase-like protein 15 isoform X7 [Homo sapiens]
MLRYPYFCRMYKECLSCWLESGIPNLGVWPNRIHTTAEKYREYEAREQTDQTQAQELHRSQDRDFETMAKLHIPVMVDEVVHCLSPQKGQIFLDMTFGSGGHTKAILQKESDIVLYALDRDPTAYALAEHLSELYPSTGTCIYPKNIRGGEACQENRFSNCSGTQHLPHHQNPAACQHRCRSISSLCYLYTERLTTAIYPYCHQDFPGSSHICEQ